MTVSLARPVLEKRTSRSLDCDRDVATDAKVLWLSVRKASRARAPDSPSSSEGRKPEWLDQTENSDSGLALARPVPGQTLLRNEDFHMDVETDAREL